MLTVAMIGVMVPNVFAQIDVTVTPHKESHQIDEPNYVTVKLSKVIPNTNVCYQIIQNGDIQLTDTYNDVYPSSMIQIDPNYLDAGKYTVHVFYGSCDVENSFGNDSTRIIVDEEPSNLAKFMQENYFPEKIDVGLNFKQSNFAYSAGNLRIHSNVYDVGNIENSMGKSYFASERQESIGVSIYKIDHLDSSEIKFRGYYSADHPFVKDKMYLKDYPSDFFPFVCTYVDYPTTPNGKKNSRGDILNCIHSNVIVQITGYESSLRQEAFFMKIVAEKINSIPIPSESKLSSMYSTQSQSVTATTSVDQGSSGDSLSIVNNECGKGTFLKNNVCVVELTCGKGTIEKNGQCVVDSNYETKEYSAKINFFDSLIKTFSSWFR